jgi:hypothetical protein
MKTTSNQFVDIYEKLFNLIFDSGIIPESWLLGTKKLFIKIKVTQMTPQIIDRLQFSAVWINCSLQY